MHSKGWLLQTISSVVLMTSPGLAQVCQPEWDLSIGTVGMNSSVFALCVFDDGSGPALYAGGLFTTAGGVAANRIAKWDGTSWTSVGGGVDAPVGVPRVYAMTVFDDGSGPALFVGGDFQTAGGSPIPYVAKWDGATWSGVGSSPGFATRAFAVFDDGSGPKLYAGTNMSHDAPDGGVWRFDGVDWSLVGGGLSDALTPPGQVNALGVFDDGSGSKLYAGGIFTIAGGVPASYIAAWDGTGWSDVGGGLNEPVWALESFDDGGGSALYAGGTFTAAGGSLKTHAVAKWTGSAWRSLGRGEFGAIFAFEIFDDGRGPALFASDASGAGPSKLSRWDGTTWSEEAADITNGYSKALASFNDGSGPSLFVGGDIFAISGQPVGFIARWRGCAAGPLPIPTVSEWGLAIMALLLVAAATCLIQKRRELMPRAQNKVGSG